MINKEDLFKGLEEVEVEDIKAAVEKDLEARRKKVTPKNVIDQIHNIVEENGFETCKDYIDFCRCRGKVYDEAVKGAVRLEKKIHKNSAKEASKLVDKMPKSFVVFLNRMAQKSTMATMCSAEPFLPLVVLLTSFEQLGLITINRDAINKLK